MKHGCVLLADSHPKMLADVRRLLEDLFSAVVMVADEASLLEAIPRMAPDIVVVDLSLPTTHGSDIMRQLCNRHPTQKVIVLSVRDEPATVLASHAVGVAGFVLTRTVSTDLGEAVKALLAGRPYVSPDVLPRSQ
jgi:DNA-binding NarL/FixJ family response regulator